jgi:hypothetical protein
MYLPENFFETWCADGNKEARRPSHVYQTRKLFLLQFEKKNSTQNIVWYPENFETCISEAGEVRSKEHSCVAEFIYPEAALGPCLRNSTSTSSCFHADEVFRKRHQRRVCASRRTNMKTFAEALTSDLFGNLQSRRAGDMKMVGLKL